MELAKCLFLLLIAFNCNVFSQKNDAPIEVKVNVLAVDANNQSVDDVKQEDIKIFEDGVEQKLIAFSKKDKNVSLSLLVDNTGSLRTQFELVVNISNSIVNKLENNDEAFVTRFVDGSRIEIMQDWTNKKDLLQKGIGDMFIQGGVSAILDAIYVTSEKLSKYSSSSQHKAIILISDCEERDSYYKYEQVMSILKASDIQIFIIGIMQELTDKKNPYTGKKNSKTNAQSFANMITLDTGGNPIFLDAKEVDVSKVVNQIFTELRSQYIISYKSTNQKRDGKPRKLTVQITDSEKGEKRQAIIREGFTVPKN